MPITNRMLAEAVGTFWLVFGGCGSAVLAAGFPQLGIGFSGVALALRRLNGPGAKNPIPSRLPSPRRWAASLTGAEHGQGRAATGSGSGVFFG